MARRRKDRKRVGGYQRRFADTDLQWLAEEFQKQAAQNPDLTLEAFALRYGVQPNLISRFVDISGKKEFKHTITVWHGTTTDRAKAIAEEGFKKGGETSTKKIWFTRKSSEARSIAQRRAQQRGGAPVVFRCEINLGKYSEFERPQPNHYAFRHTYISKDVIRSVSGLDANKAGKPPQEKGNKKEWIDVIITKTSGRLGVLCWINRYLELKGEAPLNEDHPVIVAIFKWVETQYVEGRAEPISDQEMLTQVMTHLRQGVQSGEKAEKGFTVE